MRLLQAILFIVYLVLLAHFLSGCEKGRSHPSRPPGFMPLQNLPLPTPSQQTIQVPTQHPQVQANGR